MARSRKRPSKRGQRRMPATRKILLVALPLAALYATLALWFVHHPRKWLSRQAGEWPLVSTVLSALGDPLGDFTDAIGLTGHDAVYEYDLEAPKGEVTFAGIPRRVGAPAPTDIRVLDRGEFLVGWSDSLRHPVWCAYHVVPEAPYTIDRRPGFSRDRELAAAPAATDYQNTGFDRGHLAPNHAIASRYGEAAQKRTFLMSNVAPQKPALNRGVWRNLEQRIADLWPARWGELWVIVGALPSKNGEKLSGTNIDVPSAFYQIVVAQSGYDVRALATIFEADERWNAWPTRALVSIDELEELSGLDFLSDLPDFIQAPLEAELPSRLWPINLADIIGLIRVRFPELFN